MRHACIHTSRRVVNEINNKRMTSINTQLSQKALLSRRKNAGFSNGFSQPYRPKKHQHRRYRGTKYKTTSSPGGRETHRASETLPAPLAPQCLDGLHSRANWLLAPLALGRAQAHVARLAIWVPVVHREADTVVHEHAIAGEGQLAPISAGRQERVPALRAEEMRLVICPLAQLRIVERNKPLVDDCRLAVIAPRRKVLFAQRSAFATEQKRKKAI
ncbi:hypothetical protein EW146_g333 [Bondarzewia mesenterica]|uniref:Uncharacterized protein n=1 Tax=Bondarzewia mesenterica TaxID=1095465 RepID=A0A4S4MDL9_9AGAM|nr:hypothetical protein EW146_g333 [Bondarzewia mesenterica]